MPLESCCISKPRLGIHAIRTIYLTSVLHIISWDKVHTPYTALLKLHETNPHCIYLDRITLFNYHAFWRPSVCGNTFPMWSAVLIWYWGLYPLYGNKLSIWHRTTDTEICTNYGNTLCMVLHSLCVILHSLYCTALPYSLLTETMHYHVMHSITTQTKMCVPRPNPSAPFWNSGVECALRCTCKFFETQPTNTKWSSMLCALTPLRSADTGFIFWEYSDGPTQHWNI